MRLNCARSHFLAAMERTLQRKERRVCVNHTAIMPVDHRRQPATNTIKDHDAHGEPSRGADGKTCWMAGGRALPPQQEGGFPSVVSVIKERMITLCRDKQQRVPIARVPRASDFRKHQYARRGHIVAHSWQRRRRRDPCSQESLHSTASRSIRTSSMHPRLQRAQKVDHRELHTFSGDKHQRTVHASIR